MFEIYDINLAKILDKDYTIVKEDKESLEKLLYLLICNDKEKMNKVYDGDEFMAKIIREVNAQTDEFDKLLFYNKEILDDKYAIEEAKEEARKEALIEGHELGLNEGREQGLSEGRELGLSEGRELGLNEGREQGLNEGRELSRVENIKETVIAMLKKNYPIEDISDITKLSIEEISNLKKEL